jgi:hypothetical protein
LTCLPGAALWGWKRYRVAHGIVILLSAAQSHNAKSASTSRHWQPLIGESVTMTPQLIF